MVCSNRYLLAPVLDRQRMFVLLPERVAQDRGMLTFIHPTEL